MRRSWRSPSRSGRSRCADLGVHDEPIRAFTIGRNTHYAVRTRQGRPAFVYILFEHQSSFNHRMPFRILKYMVRIWDRWLTDHNGTNALPLVLPVLLHNGKSGWKAGPEFAAML